MLLVIFIDLGSFPSNHCIFRFKISAFLTCFSPVNDPLCLIIPYFFKNIFLFSPFFSSHRSIYIKIKSKHVIMQDVNKCT